MSPFFNTRSARASEGLARVEGMTIRKMTVRKTKNTDAMPAMGEIFRKCAAPSQAAAPRAVVCISRLRLRNHQSREENSLQSGDTVCWIVPLIKRMRAAALPAAADCDRWNSHRQRKIGIRGRA